MSKRNKIKNQMVETLNSLQYFAVEEVDMKYKKEAGHLFFGYRLPYVKDAKVVNITNEEIAKALEKHCGITGPFFTHQYYTVSKDYLEVITSVFLADDADIEKAKLITGKPPVDEDEVESESESTPEVE